MLRCARRGAWFGAKEHEYLDTRTPWANQTLTGHWKTLDSRRNPLIRLRRLLQAVAVDYAALRTKGYVGEEM